MNERWQYDARGNVPTRGYIKTDVGTGTFFRANGTYCGKVKIDGEIRHMRPTPYWGQVVSEIESYILPEEE